MDNCPDQLVFGAVGMKEPRAVGVSVDELHSYFDTLCLY